MGAWLAERSVRIHRNHILTICLDTQFTGRISFITEIAVIAVTKTAAKLNLSKSVNIPFATFKTFCQFEF